MESLPSPIALLLILLSMVSFILMLMSFYLYVPIFKRIVRKHDLELFIRSGEQYIYQIGSLIFLIYDLMVMYPKSRSQQVRFHARVLRFLLAYPTIILFSCFLALVGLHYFGLIDSD